ncbi:hypothetical protein [Flavobacterium sp. 245]|uniref:hypothetical protein n=1 Tax=Flavobacterium sp. 245 TaxID=2512115 RepID=UPI00105E6488|nr:hypothetical protein [Flavobacterium sp. 245]TDP03758.1 hypothetical protein EV145_101145 [Flavobacterium sp. 245]
MRRIFIGFMICLLFWNCAKKDKKIVEKNKPYIISKENNRQIINGDTVPPPPIPGFLVYGTNTFIIDSDSTIYYFKRGDVGHICGNWDRGDTIAYFINLQPKDLTQIPTNSISNFIKSNYKDHFRNMTFIASKSDTLKTKAYFDLVKALKSSLKERDQYFMRRTTQEEDTVLKYKKNNQYYNSKNIKWDDKRISFPFIKPKLNH